MPRWLYFGFLQSHARQFVWEYFRREESRVTKQIAGFLRARFQKSQRCYHRGINYLIGHLDLRESFSCCPRESEARVAWLPAKVLQRSDGLATLPLPGWPATRPGVNVYESWPCV